MVGVPSAGAMTREVQTALDDIKGFEWQVRDYEAMAANERPQQGREPPPARSRSCRRGKDIQKTIEKNTIDRDLDDRVNTLKDWSDEKRISALERRIIETTRTDRIAKACHF